MLDPAKVLATVRRATALIRSASGRTGGVVSPPVESIDEVLVVGDLHGHVEVFAAALKAAALDSNPRRHLVVQELAHDTRVDADEGQVDRSHRLIDVVCAVVGKYPDRVHYLLGNHELSELTGRSISKNGAALNALFRAGVAADYPDHVEGFLAAYHGLFAALPLAVRLPNRVMLCHTIPDARDLETFDSAILEAETWPEEALRRGGAVYALTWGRDEDDANVDRFAELVDADLFVCGHQPCDEGYRRANRRVLILDGTEPLPAYARFSAHTTQTIESLTSQARHLAF